MIRTIKEVITKQLAVEPDTYWSDHLPAALITLRLSASRAHGYPPFALITGLLPVLPSDLSEIQPPPLLPEGEPTPEEETRYKRMMLSTINDVHAIAKLRMAKRDLILQRR